LTAGQAGRWTVRAVLLGYLLAAAAITWRLWADPAARTVAGNPGDADLFAWFMRYSAIAVSHGRLPALVTTAMNAPGGINVLWNTSLLLPGVLLAPVTLIFGPQASLTVLVTAGFAGSAASMFGVLRRWRISPGAAALAGAVYGFSPALLHSAIGHYNLQFAVLPPLIIDAGLRVAIGRRERAEPGPRGLAADDRGELADVRQAPPGQVAVAARDGLAGVRQAPPGQVAAAARDGGWLGLLVVAQLFTSEELLLGTSLAGVLLVVGLAAARPRAAWRRLRPAAAGLGAALAVTALLAGWALYVQFAGPLTQHGSAFLADFFENDVTGFVTASQYLYFHSAADAAAAARYRGGAPEYLAYLGWPLIAALVAGTVACWRRPAVRALALTVAGLELLSLGGHPLVGGMADAGVNLPWHWIEVIAPLGSALPDRLSIIADGAAAALLAICLDLARVRLATAGPWLSQSGTRPAPSTTLLSPADSPQATADSPLSPADSLQATADTTLARARAWLPAVLAGLAVLACLPLLPRPLPAATAAPLPAGWQAAFGALHLPGGARVLVVPVPTPTLTAAMRWQADTGQPDSLIGGYFIGPSWYGQAYVGGNGVTATARYLDQLWIAGLPPGAAARYGAAVPATGAPAVPEPTSAQLHADLGAWHAAAVIAVTAVRSPLGAFLTQLFGRPTAQAGDVLAWRL
jgi:hypothetical protein